MMNGPVGVWSWSADWLGNHFVQEGDIDRLAAGSHQQHTETHSRDCGCVCWWSWAQLLFFFFYLSDETYFLLYALIIKYAPNIAERLDLSVSISVFMSVWGWSPCFHIVNSYLCYWSRAFIFADVSKFTRTACEDTAEQATVVLLDSGLDQINHSGWQQAFF